MILTENFKNAIYDYIYFLEKEYPQKAILKLIGDRYLLSGIQRTMLYRGITTKENSLKRTSKLITENLLSNQILHIDGYNVLITIGSYLNGNTVFVSNDNFLRDAFGRPPFRQMLNRSGIHNLYNWSWVEFLNTNLQQKDYPRPLRVHTSIFLLQSIFPLLQRQLLN